MLRLFYITCVSLLISSAAFVYGVKYEVQGQMKQAAEVERRIAKEKETIALLRAEWSHLNRPEYLQALAQKHLNMKNQSVQQMGKFADLPVRTGPSIASVQDVPMPLSATRMTTLQ